MQSLNEVDEAGNPDFKVTRQENNIVVQFSTSTEKATDNSDGPKKVKLDLVVPDNLNLTFDIFVNNQPLVLNVSGCTAYPGFKTAFVNPVDSLGDCLGKGYCEKENCESEKCLNSLTYESQSNCLRDYSDSKSKVSGWSLTRNSNQCLPVKDNDISLSTVGVQTDILLGVRNISESCSLEEAEAAPSEESCHRSQKFSDKQIFEKYPSDISELSTQNQSQDYRRQFSKFFAKLKKDNPLEYVNFLYKIYMIPVRYLLSMYSDMDSEGQFINRDRDFQPPETIEEMGPLLSTLVSLEDKFEVLKLKMPKMDETTDRPTTPYQDALSDSEASEFYECSSDNISQTGGNDKRTPLQIDPCGCQFEVIRTTERIGDFYSHDFNSNARCDSDISKPVNSSLENLRWPKPNLVPLVSDPSDVIA